MEVEMFTKNLGKGPAIGHGRVLWVHNPLGSKAGKAKDPYINLATLARLSHDPKVRLLVEGNLEKRMRGDITQTEVSYIFANFNRDLLIDLLANKKFGNYFVHEAIRGLIGSIHDEAPRDPKYVKLLARDPKVRQMLINLAAYPVRSTFLYGGDQSFKESYVAKGAFFKLDKGMTPDELLQIVQRGPSAEVMRLIVSEKIASPITIAICVDKITERSKVVIDSQEQGHFDEVLDVMNSAQGTGVCLPPHSTGVPSQIWVVDSWEKSHSEYDASDISSAFGLISNKKEKIADILAALHLVNPELARLMTQEILLAASVSTEDHGLAIDVYSKMSFERKVDAVAVFAQDRLAEVDRLIESAMPGNRSVTPEKLWKEMVQGDEAESFSAKMKKLHPELSNVADKIVEQLRACFRFWVANFPGGIFSRNEQDREEEIEILDIEAGLYGLSSSIEAYSEFLNG